jgi:hypothetical protein
MKNNKIKMLFVLMALVLIDQKGSLGNKIKVFFGTVKNSLKDGFNSLSQFKKSRLKEKNKPTGVSFGKRPVPERFTQFSRRRKWHEEIPDSLRRYIGSHAYTRAYPQEYSYVYYGKTSLTSYMLHRKAADYRKSIKQIDQFLDECRLKFSTEESDSYSFTSDQLYLNNEMYSDQRFRFTSNQEEIIPRELSKQDIKREVLVAQNNPEYLQKLIEKQVIIDALIKMEILIFEDYQSHLETEERILQSEGNFSSNFIETVKTFQRVNLRGKKEIIYEAQLWLHIKKLDEQIIKAIKEAQANGSTKKADLVL